MSLRLQLKVQEYLSVSNYFLIRNVFFVSKGNLFDVYFIFTFYVSWIFWNVVKQLNAP